MSAERATIPMTEFKKFPTAPASLQAAGKKAWKVGEPLWKEGVLKERDLRAWETYCRAIDEIESCNRVLKKTGEYVALKGGAIQQHPAVNRRRDAEKTLWRYEQAFGLVPEKRNKRPAANNTKGVAQRKK